ncbi:hypothetical protein ABZ863_31775 [Saccharomonospora sp. NPDC046836]|uniref:hypothetical protein n=1 Tax=Saccharomonospora sp. NPDC046836 TaxID=3156921 RepID=UPI0033DA2A8C
MPTTTMLDHATAVIENAWGQPIEALEVLGVRRSSEDPLLRCAMHTRTALAITDISVHQDRFHALSRHGYVPDFYELDRITDTAVSLRVATQRVVRTSRRTGAWWRLVRPPHPRLRRQRFGWHRPLSPAPGRRGTPRGPCPNRPLRRLPSGPGARNGVPTLSS